MIPNIDFRYGNQYIYPFKKKYFLNGSVAELVDALDLGSSAFGCGGSSPPAPILEII